MFGELTNQIERIEKREVGLTDMRRRPARESANLGRQSYLDGYEDDGEYNLDFNDQSTLPRFNHRFGRRNLRRPGTLDRDGDKGLEFED